MNGYMLICRNTEGVHGQRKVGNPWPSRMGKALLLLLRGGSLVRLSLQVVQGDAVLFVAAINGAQVLMAGITL